VERNNQFQALSPAKLDLNADTWKPVLLTGVTQFPVTAPDAISSPAYQADLNEIKAYQRNITDDQKALIAYWSAGAILRWNEILREPGSQAQPAALPE
jgi:hypothetical protein